MLIVSLRGQQGFIALYFLEIEASMSEPIH